MTALALIAVLPAGAARTLGEPGTTLVAGPGLLGLCVPAPDLGTADSARDAILRQHDLLVRVALAHDLVPVRTGAVFSDRERIVATLAAQAATYRRVLDRVAGKLELTLGICAPTSGIVPAETAGVSGLDYLRARRQRRSLPVTGCAERLLADALARATAGLPAQRQPGPDATDVSATVLVPRTGLAFTMSALERWTKDVATPAGATVRVLGPWPCYAFTTAEVGHAAT